MHKQLFARIVEPERLTIQDPEVLCQEETQFSSVYKTEALLCTKHICSEKRVKHVSTKVFTSVSNRKSRTGCCSEFPQKVHQRDGNYKTEFSKRVVIVQFTSAANCVVIGEITNHVERNCNFISRLI